MTRVTEGEAAGARAANASPELPHDNPLGMVQYGSSRAVIEDGVADPNIGQISLSCIMTKTLISVADCMSHLASHMSHVACTARCVLHIT